MSLTSLLVPTYAQMLAALAGWLDKAQAELTPADAEALLSARLAPDMFPLSTQIRFACVQAREGVLRLGGAGDAALIAELIDEGRNAGEQPGSLSDSRTRIDATLALLDSLAPDALDTDPDSALAHELPNGMILDLAAGQYARDWALSQFYFHIMTAYAILRSEKVELGKADFIPHMLPYFRPGTIPNA